MDVLFASSLFFIDPSQGRLVRFLEDQNSRSRICLTAGSMELEANIEAA